MCRHCISPPQAPCPDTHAPCTGGLDGRRLGHSAAAAAAQRAGRASCQGAPAAGPQQGGPCALGSLGSSPLCTPRGAGSIPSKPPQPLCGTDISSRPSRTLRGFPNIPRRQPFSIWDTGSNPFSAVRSPRISSFDSSFNPPSIGACCWPWEPRGHRASTPWQQQQQQQHQLWTPQRLGQYRACRGSC